MLGFFLDLGFGYKVALNEILAIMPISVSTVKQLYNEKRKAGKSYRATKGRKAISLILLKNDTVFTSALTPDELVDNIREIKLIGRRGEFVNAD